MLQVINRIIKNAILCTLIIVEGIAWLPILLALGGGYLLAQLGKKEEPTVSGEHPEGEVLGEYPGGLFTFETLTPQQKEMLQALMSYAMPKLGLPGQAFGQAPAGTTAGAGLGAGAGAGAGTQGMLQEMMPALSGLLMGGSKGTLRGGGR